MDDFFFSRTMKKFFFSWNHDRLWLISTNPFAPSFFNFFNFLCQSIRLLVRNFDYLSWKPVKKLKSSYFTLFYISLLGKDTRFILRPQCVFRSRWCSYGLACMFSLVFFFFYSVLLVSDLHFMNHQQFQLIILFRVLLKKEVTYLLYGLRVSILKASFQF